MLVCDIHQLVLKIFNKYSVGEKNLNDDETYILRSGSELSEISVNMLLCLAAV